MKNAIDMHVGAIKCDNPKCDYINNNINQTDYKHWVNKKCPKCGEILLTEKDYNVLLFLLKTVSIANKIFPKRKDNDIDSIMSLNTDGSGNMHFTIQE